MTVFYPLCDYSTVMKVLVTSWQRPKFPRKFMHPANLKLQPPHLESSLSNFTFFLSLLSLFLFVFSRHEAVADAAIMILGTNKQGDKMTGVFGRIRIQQRSNACFTVLSLVTNDKDNRNYIWASFTLYTRSMVTTGHAQRDDIKILGHCGVSICLYVCLCPQCHFVSILHVLLWLEPLKIQSLTDLLRHVRITYIQSKLYSPSSHSICLTFPLIWIPCFSETLRLRVKVVSHPSKRRRRCLLGPELG